MLSPSQKLKSGTTLRVRSIDDVIRCMQWSENEYGKLPRAKRDRTVYVSAKDWTWPGTDTVGEYINLLRDGWPAAVKDKTALDGLCSDAFERPQMRRDVGGAFANVPACIAGMPDSMYSFRMQPSEQARGVTLILDCSYSGSVDPDDILTYAHKVMELVAWLIAERIEVNVYAVAAGHQRSTRTLYLTPVRTSDQVLQPERIAAVLHPSFLRRGRFAVVEYEALVEKIGYGDCIRTHGKGYATPRTAEAEELREAIPSAYAIVQLPKPSRRADPRRAVENALNIKLKQGD